MGKRADRASPRAVTDRSVLSRVGAVCIAMLFAAVAVRGGESITYTLTPLPAEGKLKVEIAWVTGQRTNSALRVPPRWGNVDDIPALIEDVTIDAPRNSSEAAAVAQRGVWPFAHRPGATVACRYSVSSRKLGIDWSRTYTPAITQTFFCGLGNSFLLTPGGVGGIPDEMEVLLRWQLPATWKAACSLGVGRSVGRRVRIEDLRQSAFLAGELDTRTRERDGRKVSVAMLDRFRFDADAFADMADAIVGGQCRFMGEKDFPEFLVLAVPVGTAVGEGESHLAGVGLYHSFVLFVAPQSRLTDGVEQLFAHELFHFWNGRLLEAAEPEGLVYWFTEGFTDYYAMRILFESGRWDAATFAKWTNRHIREYVCNPAIRASNDEIQREYWSQRETVGQVAYQRGFLLGLRWHRLARQRGVSDGVDRLFKALVTRARSASTKLSNELIRHVGNETLGAWFDAEFERYVVNAEPVDVPADALSPALTGRASQAYEFSLGFDRKRSLEQKRVIGLSAESPAARAGLREGDELAGWTLHSDPDRKISLRVKRDGSVQPIEFLPRGAARQTIYFVPGNKSRDER
ncbi:MAG: hypothetical protein U1D55_08715 [Phycisphaerae bacterium]